VAVPAAGIDSGTDDATCCAGATGREGFRAGAGAGAGEGGGEKPSEIAGRCVRASTPYSTAPRVTAAITTTGILLFRGRAAG
jgi:hypothetical protein